MNIFIFCENFLEEVSLCSELKPTYIGFFGGSKFSFLHLKNMRERLGKEKIVAVFENAPYDVISHYVEEELIDVALLTGIEDENYIDTLKACATNLEIWKEFKIPQAGLNEEEIHFINESLADLVFIRVKDFNEKNFVSLNDIKRPYILSGNINYNNYEKIIKNTSPYCVDISSNFDENTSRDGIRLKQMVELIRNKDGI